MPDDAKLKRDSIPTASAILDDQRIVELVYVPRERRTALVVGGPDAVKVVERVALPNGTTLVPISPSNNLIRHGVIVLPAAAEDPGSPERLIADIESYILRYLDVSAAFLKVASTYVCLSWVYDAFNELPYLRFRGDFGSGKTRALAVVGSLLNKGFFASGASTVSPIFHILDAFRGSLILDEADFRFSDEKAELSKILNNGNVAGFPVLRQTMNARREFDPKAFQLFGPKIVAARQSFEDVALESRFLTEDMGFRPVPSHIPLNLPAIQKDEARALRDRLLGYRFAYRHIVAIDRDLVDADRSPRTNQIIAPLLAVAPTTVHREAIAAFASDMDDAVKADQGASLDAVLVEVLAALSSVNEGPIPVSDIARAFAARTTGDADRPVTPRYTGFLIRKRLRLRTLKRHGVYVVPESERARLAMLATRFGID